VRWPMPHPLQLFKAQSAGKRLGEYSGAPPVPSGQSVRIAPASVAVGVRRRQLMYFTFDWGDRDLRLIEEIIFYVRIKIKNNKTKWRSNNVNA
jgi:hypothetical protein